MNREILFRAKFEGNDGRQWVYGALIPGDPLIIAVKNSEGPGFTFHNCIPGTEGQYTGFKDYNGQRIFEGDIMGSFSKSPSVVVFNNGSWCIIRASSLYAQLSNVLSSRRVIGNVTDDDPGMILQ